VGTLHLAVNVLFILINGSQLSWGLVVRLAGVSLCIQLSWGLLEWSADLRSLRQFGPALTICIVYFFDPATRCFTILQHARGLSGHTSPSGECAVSFFMVLN